MKYIKKHALLILLTAIFSLFVGTANASPTVLYEKSSTQTITSGATLQKVTRFTSEGWLNINILKVSLYNKNIQVGTIINSSLKKLEPTKNAAQSNNAVAAINGGFFNWLKDSGYPDGPIVYDGKIVTASSEYNKYNNSMATLSISKLNRILYEFWKTDIQIVTANGNSQYVTQYNKASTNNYNDITIWDRKWSDISMGCNDYPDTIEVVVDNDVVVDIRESQPAVAIPENGYVLITRSQCKDYVYNNFNLGEKVKLNINTTPSWDSVKTAITGSAILLKDGNIPEKFSYDIAGKQPRTAIGSSEDNRFLFLVTVDGRQVKSIGMTQYELAEYLQSIGVHNALNLDGGGSTTMVARDPVSAELQVVNNPSDGGARAVATSFGVFSIAPPSTLKGLIIDTKDTNVFVNTSMKFNVRGYDKFYNPIYISPEQITWEVEGIGGWFDNAIFHPAEVGNGKITAKIGNASGSIDITSLDTPSQLFLNQKILKVPLKQSATLGVTAKTSDGYSAYIDPADIKWSVGGEIGTLNNNIFEATNSGVGYIEASLSDAHSYCKVIVATSTSTLVDDFETANASFASSPSAVQGAYEISREKRHSGKYSGKLSYDFTSLEGTRAAYAVLNDGIALNQNTEKIGVWLYNTHVNSNWIRAEVLDSDGNKAYLDFIKGMDFTGWKYAESSSVNIKRPAKLTKLYIVQPSPVADLGSIYFDDLTIADSSYPNADDVNVPSDSVSEDDKNTSDELTGSAENTFSFGIIGNLPKPQNFLQNILLSKLYQKDFNFSYVIENKTNNGTMKNSILGENLYDSLEYDSNLFLKLDTSKQGLRTTDSAEWKFFLEKLDSFDGDNVFIMLSSPLSNFTDPMESDLFKEILAKKIKASAKNICVFYKGDKNESYMENGVKYISTIGFAVDNITPSNTDDIKYAEVNIQGEKISIKFKPVN